MKLFDLTESSNGTFVSVRLTPKSNRRLVAWMDQELIQEPMGGDELHCTLILDKTKKLAYDPIVYDPPIPIDPETYHIDIFGPDKDVLVLTFDCPILEDRQAKLMKKYNLVSEWGEYKPHITLSTLVQEITTDLEPPTFELEFYKESVEAFSLANKD